MLHFTGCEALDDEDIRLVVRIDEASRGGVRAVGSGVLGAGGIGGQAVAPCTCKAGVKGVSTDLHDGFDYV